MKHLLSILIFLSFMSVASADEIRLACYNQEYLMLNEYTEVQIDLQKKKLWHYQGYYMDIVAVTDSKIYAERKIYSETFSIDRFSGTAVYSNGMMDPAEVTKYTCKKLDKLF